MKPILFNSEMVRAILDEPKTVTRRVMRSQPPANYVPCPIYPGWKEIWVDGIGNVKLPFEVGDVLYVRETWKCATIDPAGGGYALQDIYLYKADEPIDTTGMLVEDRWHPSIHMPKEAARIFLRVKAVRVERLQDITVDDVLKEGTPDIEPPPICRKEISYPNSFPKGFDAWEKEKQGDWIESTARARYIGWLEYAKNLFAMFEKIWDSTIKPAERDKYGWDANPWVWVIEFERVDKQ